jgi:hypothetical protein
MLLAMNGTDFIANTNILIYILEGHPGVEAILQDSFAASVISEIELLGKPRINHSPPVCNWGG